MGRVRDLKDFDEKKKKLEEQKATEFDRKCDRGGKRVIPHIVVGDKQRPWYAAVVTEKRTLRK